METVTLVVTRSLTDEGLTEVPSLKVTFGYYRYLVLVLCLETTSNNDLELD